MGGPGNLSAFAAALTPAAILAIWLWVVDRGRSSWDLVGQAITLGAMLVPAVLLPEWMVDAALAEAAIDLGLGESRLELIVTAVCAPLLEEAGRLCVLLLVLARHEDFHPIHFVIVAGWLSLGLAGVENAGYLVLKEEWGVPAVLRATTAVPMHVIVGLTMGAFLRAHTTTRSRTYLLLAYLVPAGLHAAYNGAAFFAGSTNGLGGTAALLGVLTALGTAPVFAVPLVEADRPALNRSRRARFAALTLGWLLLLAIVLTPLCIAISEMLSDLSLGRRVQLTMAVVSLPLVFAVTSLREARRIRTLENDCLLSKSRKR